MIFALRTLNASIKSKVVRMASGVKDVRESVRAKLGFGRRVIGSVFGAGRRATVGVLGVVVSAPSTVWNFTFTVSLRGVACAPNVVSYIELFETAFCETRAAVSRWRRVSFRNVCQHFYDVGAYGLLLSARDWWYSGQEWALHAALVPFLFAFGSAAWWATCFVVVLSCFVPTSGWRRVLWASAWRHYVTMWFVNYLSARGTPGWVCWCCGEYHASIQDYIPYRDGVGLWVCRARAHMPHQDPGAFEAWYHRAWAWWNRPVWRTQQVSLRVSRERSREIERRRAEKARTIAKKVLKTPPSDSGGEFEVPTKWAGRTQQVMFKGSALSGTATMASPDLAAPGYAQQTRGQKLAELFQTATSSVASNIVFRKAVDTAVSISQTVFGADEREAKTLASALLSTEGHVVRGMTEQATSLLTDCWIQKSFDPLWEPAPLDLPTAIAGVKAHSRLLGVAGDGCLPVLTDTYNQMISAMKAERARGRDLPPTVVAAFYEADSAYRLAMAARESRRCGFKPLIVNLIGPPGTGKSTLLERTFALVVDEVCGVDAKVDMNQMIDKITLDDKFDSTSTPLTIIGKLDDPVVMRGDTGEEDKNVLGKLIWSVATGDQRPALKAVAEEKGMSTVNYVYVGWASNTLFSGLVPADFATPAAFARRVQVMRLDWVNPNDEHVIDETLFDGPVSFDAQLEGRVLRHGVAVVKGDAFAFELVHPPVVGGKAIREYLKTYIAGQMSRLSKLAVDKNMICRECWSAPCCKECGKNDVRGAGFVQRAAPKTVEVSDVDDAGRGALALVASAVHDMGNVDVEPVAAVPIQRAVLLVVAVVVLLVLLGWWVIPLWIVFEVATRWPVRRVQTASAWYTCALWDLAAWLVRVWPSGAVILVSFARWRSRCDPAWVRAYVRERVCAVPRWAAAVVAVAAVGIWLYKRRNAPRSAPVARIDLSDVQRVESQLDALGHSAEVLGGKVAEIDALKVLDEVDFEALGEPATLDLYARVRTRVADPIVLGPKANTATWAQLRGSIDQRCMLLSAQAEGSPEVVFGVGSLWDQGLILTCTHNIPSADRWSLTYAFQGESVTRFYEGRVDKCDKGPGWAKKGDVLLVSVPGLSSAMRVGGFSAQYQPRDLIGVQASVVLGRSGVVETGPLTEFGVEPGMFTVDGFYVSKGMSGSPVWVVIGKSQHPVFLGIVSRSTIAGESPRAVFALPVTTALVDELKGAIGHRTISTCGPEVPACWLVSSEVHDKSVVMFEGVRGLFVGAVVNVPQQRIRWEPFPARPQVAPDLWAARDVGKLVFDEGGARTGCAPVGRAGGREVVWYDGFCATRAALRKTQRVQAWHPDLLNEAVKLTAQFLGDTSHLEGWTVPLSMHEALNGIPGRLSAINLKSGAGPNWPGKVAAYVSRNDRGVLVANPDFEREADACVDRWSSGIAKDFVGKVSVKAETRKMSKDIARNIFVFDAPTNVALKRLFGRLFAALGAAGYRNGLLVMCNSVSPEFSKYLKTLHGDGAKVLDLDKAAMDWSYNSCVWELLVKLMRALEALDPHYVATPAREAALMSLQVGLLLVGRYLYYVRIGLGSGWWVTTLVNTLVELTLLVATMVHASAEAGFRLDAKVLRRVLKPAIVGDDDCSQVVAAFVEAVKLRPGVYLRVTEPLGFKTTSGDKTPLGTEFASKKGLRFLKRSLDIVQSGPRAGELQCSLPVDSILKALYVREAGDYLPAAGAATISNASREAWLLPDGERQRVQDIIRQVAEGFVRLYPGVAVPLMSEDQFLDMWRRGEFITWDSA